MSVFTDEEFGCFDEGGEILLLFGCAGLFIFIGGVLDDFFVCCGAGDEEDGEGGVASDGLCDHAQDTELGLQDLTGAGASAFDEELDRVAFVQDFVDIEADAGAIEDIAFE